MEEQPRADAQAETEQRLRHGSSFGAAAAAYAEHRPDYAEAAVRWALEPVWSRQLLRVIDLGAGTGKLTATLVRLGVDVTAVEPDPDMLAELATIATHSHFLVMEEPERGAQLARVAGFLQVQPETARGDFVLPMLTVVLRALRE